MKFHKKSAADFLTSPVFWIVISIIFFIAVAVIIRQSGGRAMYYVSKLIGIG